MSVVGVGIAAGNVVGGSAIAGSALLPFAIVPLLAVMAISAGIGAINARAEADGLRRGALDEIGRIRDKLNGISEPESAGKLLRALGDAERFVENAGGDGDRLRSVREELRSLAMKASKAELDASQRARRAGAVREAIAQIRAMGPFSEREQLERIKTERIEGEIADISSAATDDRMTEMRRMLDELDGVKNSRARIALGGEGILERGEGPGGEKKLDEENRLIAEIRDLASRIADLDEQEGALATALAGNLSACTQFPDRLRSIRRQLSASFASVRERAAATAYFRETLTSLRGELETANGLINSADARRLASRCDTLRGAKHIDRQDFMALYEDIAKFAAASGEAIADSYFAAKVKDELERMGYALAEDENFGGGGADAAMEPGRVNYLETPYEGYRVMAKVGGGELSARLVRVTDADEPETADNQAALDREAGQKWCGDFDEFLARMQEAGLPIDVTLRREPDEAEVIATPVKGAKKKKSARKSRARGTQTEGRMRARDGEAE